MSRPMYEGNKSRVKERLIGNIFTRSEGGRERGVLGESDIMKGKVSTTY